MEVETLPDALKKIMELHGWTQTDLARELGVSQNWVSDITRGRKDTGIGKAARLLARVGWKLRISPKTEEPVERREFLTAAASVIFIPSAQANPYQDAAYVRTLTESIARNRYELGGIPLIPAAMAHVGRIRTATTETQDNELRAAASELLDQIALVLYDSDRLTQADQIGRLALELAVSGNDLQGQGRAYGTLSRISLDRGDHARGVMYAQKGLRVPGLSGSTQATLNMRLGRSLALIPGQETASRASLDRALDTPGLSAFSEAALIGDIGIAMGNLREYRRAEAMLQEAADRIGQWSPLFQAQYLGRQVQTALKAADPSLAADRMQELARALPFVASARVNKRVSDILKASAQWDKLPEMRQAREQLQTVAS